MGKGTNLISELSTFFEKSENNRAIDCILGMMKSIRISEKSIGLYKMYNCKMSSWQVVCLLLVFPFFCVKNALQYESSTLGRLFRCKKDMFYDFMNSDLVDWRKILDMVNRQLLRIVAAEESNRQQHENPAKKDRCVRCLIADDTDLPKTGKAMELIGKIHSHVSHKNILGFKCLTLIFTDGKSQTFLDASLHGEEGNAPGKKQGLTAKEQARRFSKEHTGEAAKSRVEDYWKKKTDKLQEMVRRAIKNGIRFDYLLVDSWFTNTPLVKFILSRHIGCHLLGMVKMGNTLYHTEFGDLPAKQIVNRLKKEGRVKKSSLLHCLYCYIDTTLGGKPVRLFFCKRGRKGDWNGLLTTDRSLDFLTAYRTYQMRWAVEVGYHECKGLLGLGKCQSRNFNAQIAAMTITFIQYNILSIVKRYHSYETIGELFNCAVGGAVEFSVTEKIWEVLLKAIFAVADKLSIYAPDVLKAIIDEDEDMVRLMNLNVKLREAA